MSYHAKIMNLRCVGWNDLYKEGHRDARHAAAEIVIGAEQEIERMESSLRFAAGVLSTMGQFRSWTSQDVYDWLKLSAMCGKEDK